MPARTGQGHRCPGRSGASGSASIPRFRTGSRSGGRPHPVVAQPLRASRRADGLAALTAWESEVLTPMAEGRSNAGIADALVVSGGTVERHVVSIFDKLGLPPDEADNRRFLAVLRYLST
ncbi:response regulator transcription factor [Actinoplanes sp. NPDC020271]|uniref:response regulator transcription factor n=1 Tax=Actinoplanes sp. NPDC020271 TaxID=3363896 RepID=UPI0037B81F2E